MTLVSVPFRGSCSEIKMIIRGGFRAELEVSVPFRGSCSEIQVKVHIMARISFMFPSPFGVRVLKFCYMGFYRCFIISFRPLSGFVF